MNNIYDLFSKIPTNKIALISGDEEITYGKLKSEVENLSVLLSNFKCNEKTIIGFLLEETPEIIVALLAISKLNAKFFAINTKYPVSVIELLISQIRPKIIIANPLLISKLGRVINSIKSFICFATNIHLLEMRAQSQINIDENVFSILFTSGTTQLPKGVFHKQSDFVFVGERCFSMWHIKENERLLSAIPIFSAATLGCILVPALCYGCTLVLPQNRKPNIIMKIVQEKKVNFVIGTPTNFIQMIKTIGNTIRYSKVRGTVTGAPIPEGFVKEVYSAIGIKLYPHYGMTELLAVSSVKEGGDGETVGQPLVDIEVKINKNNEILVKTPAMTSGYVDDSPLPIDNEKFFHTRDLGTIDVNGNLKLLGRKDDMIIRGGNNIYPVEIESALLKNYAVVACGVTSMQDSEYGQKIVAFVKLRDKNTKNEQLKEFLQQYLPVFKIPDEFIFVDDIPMTESGKIKRHELKTLYSNLNGKFYETKSSCGRNGDNITNR